MSKLIFTDNEWTFERIDKVFNAIESIAETDLQLDTYPNQLEIISAEQMLDAYSSVGLPLSYAHWSFGKQRAIEAGQYQRGEMGLAYEIVVNSNPCISYLMEENTMMMQTLVIAHAAFGHNAFFKNNESFKQWTDASSIIDYLAFAKKYISECEIKYGYNEVADVLDIAHSLRYNSVDRARRPHRLSLAEEEKRSNERYEYLQTQLNILWNTIPAVNEDKATKDKKTFPSEPQDNLLYFIEKHAQNLPSWKREILRIVRKVGQYLYPQSQTKIMNEGFACFTHYYIMNRMYDSGLITEGTLMEFLASHTAVTLQPDFDKPYYSGFNPYALGFSMFMDIKRICQYPTAEDREWFSFAGDPDWLKHIHFAMREFKDASFIQQYLSPHLMRKFHLFSLYNSQEEQEYRVSNIHNNTGFKRIRELLAQQVADSTTAPDIQITHVDLWGDRALTLELMSDRIIHSKDATKVVAGIEKLWGFPVRWG
jgi:spore cortex formation protein SpoVR/YcgB (stage V sporulation)